jgi:hypothetical protein
MRQEHSGVVGSERFKVGFFDPILGIVGVTAAERCEPDVAGQLIAETSRQVREFGSKPSRLLPSPVPALGLELTKAKPHEIVGSVQEHQLHTQ